VLREIGFILIPLVVPAVLVLIWRRLSGSQGPMPWLPAFAAGVILMTGVLALLAVYDRAAPDAQYRPPHIEDGQIVPGGIDR